MADHDQLALLQSSVTGWNRWRRENPSIAIDLRGAYLAGANIAGAFLEAADLGGADLARANLDDAQLVNANLTGASLAGASLYRTLCDGADLIGANLTKASLWSTSLYGADLTKANLSESEPVCASFIEANLHFTDLRHADLAEANLSDIRTRDTNFDGAILERTIFGAASLSGALNLENCVHNGPSVIDLSTLERSGSLPVAFLRGCGVPEAIIGYLPAIIGRGGDFYSCFISYSHADKSFARWLHDQLQRRGIRCWLDEHQLLPGDDIHDRIQHGVRLWDKTLLCCSKSSLTSWWVDNEIETAFAKERDLTKQRGHKVLTLIPINLDGYLFSGQWRSGKEDQVRSRHAVDFFGWERNDARFERAVEHLVKALSVHECGRETPPPLKL